LAATPSINDIIVTPQNSLSTASFWISTVTSAQFTINTSAAAGVATFIFSWQADVFVNS
jgi:hypothetical protein